MMLIALQGVENLAASTNLARKFRGSERKHRKQVFTKLQHSRRVVFIYLVHFYLQSLQWLKVALGVALLLKEQHK